MCEDKTRGFSALIGETIVSVDTEAINVVTLMTASGKKIDIDAEDQHFGIGIITANIQQN